MFKPVHTIREAPYNKPGLVDLSAGGSPSFLAYSGSASDGQVGEVNRGS